MDLSTLGLSEEKTAELTAHINQQTTGLKNKVDELLGEKKSVQSQSTDLEAQLEAARQASVSAEEKRLVEAGEYKAALELREKETTDALASSKLATESAQNALKDRDYGTAQNKLLNLFHDSHKLAGEALLSKGLKISYNDQGQPVSTFEYDGAVVANNEAEFKSWAGEQASFKQYLNGVDSSGADTARSNNGVIPTNKSYSEMSLSEQVAHNEKK